MWNRNNEYNKKGDYRRKIKREGEWLEENGGLENDDKEEWMNRWRWTRSGGGQGWRRIRGKGGLRIRGG